MYGPTQSGSPCSRLCPLAILGTPGPFRCCAATNLLGNAMCTHAPTTGLAGHMGYPQGACGSQRTHSYPEYASETLSACKHAMMIATGTQPAQPSCCGPHTFTLGGRPCRFCSHSATVQFGNTSETAVFLAENPVPEYPSEGLHILQPQLGDVVDIVIQAAPANALNGDYR